MSAAKSRPQYAFIEVKELSMPSVTLLGPSSVVDEIAQIVKSDKCIRRDVQCTTSSLANTVELSLRGQVTYGFNAMLFKASFLEEVVKQAFKPLSNVADDFLVLSREVPLLIISMFC